jgi:long-chain acyl-CoA synthetase
MSNNNGRRISAVHSVSAMPPLEQVFKGRRILITGATGFLGKVFLVLLLRWHPEVERVYLLIRGDRRSSLNRFRREIVDSPVMGPLRNYLGAAFDQFIEKKIVVLPGDITNAGLVEDDDAELAPTSLDVVVHSAGLVNFEASLEKALEINATGVANVLAFCRRTRAAMLHVSTCYVAGAADGQRYEDDIPVDWCPSGKRSFKLEREIRDALAAVARVEAESREQLRHAEFMLDDNGDDEPTAGVEYRRKEWVEERLKEVGKQRALKWGWPNTYSYTKSLGEQLVVAARDELDVTVVRPAVIESAIRDPFPGWNQGVNTSAPLTYLAGRGYRFYPAEAELVLDVIPVDLAAHAMIPIVGALLLKRQKLIYQLCTSDRNPLPMRRLVELVGLGTRREQRREGGAMSWIGPHIEAVVVSQSTYDFGSLTMPRLLKQASEFVRGALGEENQPAKRIDAALEKFKDNTDIARELVEVYRPYIQELIYTFHGRNVRALYAELRPQDLEHHPYDPEKIDWHDYWINVHMVGLRKHIFPQLDLHTRGRPRGLPRRRSLVEMLDRAADRYGAAIAMTARRPSGETTSVTYRELADKAHRAALLLATRGVKPGDRVLLVAENSPDWVLAYFAILCAGAVAVPLDHLISTEELQPICKIAEPVAALLSTTLQRRVSSTLKSLRNKVVEIDLAELSRPFIMKGDVKPAPAPERKSLASIVFTSGTTGAPKGVMLTHGNFASEIAMLSRVFTLDADDVVLSLLPLHHTFEFTCGMLLPIASGAQIAYPLEVDAKTLSRTLADIRPTALIGVPALWEAIHRRTMDEVEERGPFFHAAFNQLRNWNSSLDADYGVNLGSLVFRQVHSALGGRLKLAVSGGSALPRRIADFFNDIGVRLLEGYGLTEASPVLSVARPDESLCAGAVGKPLSGVEIKLLPEGAEVGEIVAQGPNVMAGYYRNQAATDEVLRDGWLHTGDLGRFDADGRLYIVGRAKEVIVDSGGNNIYIEELEELYGHNEYVKELAVVGLKVGQGEQVAALIVPAYSRGESRRTVEDRLRAHFDQVSERISPHKRIRIIRFTDAELPRTRTRKVKRAEVANLLRLMLEARGDAAQSLASAEVEQWLAQALAQLTSDPIAIAPSTRLVEDLGLDSLAMAELGEQLGEHAGRDIAPEEISDLRTVADLQTLVTQPTANGRTRLPSYARFAEPFTIKLPGPLRRLGRLAVRGSERLAFDSWLKPKILGSGNIPANSNFLVVANHSSHLDFGLLGHAFGAFGRDLRVLAAKDYFFNTRTRRFLASNFTMMMPFDRERAQLESLDEALGELADGRSVLMFPEGTRSVDGRIQDFKSGAGYLALRSGCDVVPVLIRGTHQVLGKGSLLPRRGPVEVRIGKSIGAAHLREVANGGEGTGAYRKIADLLHEAVVNLAPTRRVRLAPPVQLAPTPRAPREHKPRKTPEATEPRAHRRHAKG